MLQVNHISRLCHKIFPECRPDEDELRRRDGSIKKNTAFSKKLVK